MTRRGLLAGLGATLLAACSGGGYAPKPRLAPGTTRVKETYGGGLLQRGEWWIPPRPGRLPTVVLVHGGYWGASYDRSLEDAVAADLSGRGYLCWNIDYSAADKPWPATLTDVAAGYDHICSFDRVDHSRIAVVGHSAGGQLALWLASRARLPAGAPGSGSTAPRPVLAVAQAPVASLARGSRDGLGGGAVDALMGGSPDQRPARYAVADPIALLPTMVRTVLIHGTTDSTVPLNQSQDYVAAATKAGDPSTLETFPGGHFEHLDPRSQAVDLLRKALGTLI
ncbi:MAG: hypothetical protein NVSMB55_09510 [Mycobacteriales bacterium]